jgi:hypothetical protein
MEVVKISNQSKILKLHPNHISGMLNSMSARGRWIFKGDKNPQHTFLRRGSKAVGPM